MDRIWTGVLLCGGIGALTLALAASRPAAGQVAVPGPDFASRIAPLLARNCLECHGPSSKQGGLDLTAQTAMLAGGKLGPSVVPGKPDASPLWKRIAANEMPPQHPLAAAEKKLIREWISAGARWEGGPIDPLRYSSERRAGYDWWSLQPVQNPALPNVKRKDWPRTPVDRFVLAKLESAGLQPSPPASPASLIRRVTYDLTGLPPTPEEVNQFVKEYEEEGRAGSGRTAPSRVNPILDRTRPPTPDPTSAASRPRERSELAPRVERAYERLVDRLLASPRYGERWARHWLDVIRFGESQGFERNKLRPNAWRYRDWVVEALNSDLPYDEFVRLQLAGDVLRPDDPLAVIASGFLVMGPYDLTAYTAVSPMMMAAGREEELEGLVGTVGQTFLGLTTNCARCHDHKFDPVSQKEYYRLAAALGGTYHGAERESLSPAGKAAAEAQKVSLEREIAALEMKLSSVPGEQVGERERLRGEIERMKSRVRLLSGGPTHTLVPKQPPAFHVLARGDFRRKGEEVAPGGIASLTSLPAEWGLAQNAPEGERRKALAAWVTDPRNPLTARVIVNRLWAAHFGAGLVRTPNDFGFNGGQPSHPELLDWLAGELVRERWSLKKLHRTLLLSATYRQGSRLQPSAFAKDAENRLLWRQNPRRLEAEAFRDAALYLSGDLDPKMGGPGYRDWTSKSHGDNETYTAFDAVGPEFNRRTLYRFTVRAGTSPFLDALDCPDPSVSAPRRSETTTPQQALLLLNNRFMEHTAGRWAERLEREAPGSRPGQVEFAYRQAFGRTPSAEELRFGEQFAGEHGLAQLCLVLLNANEFMVID